MPSYEAKSFSSLWYWIVLTPSKAPRNASITVIVCGISTSYGKAHILASPIYKVAQAGKTTRQHHFKMSKVLFENFNSYLLFFELS